MPYSTGAIRAGLQGFGARRVLQGRRQPLTPKAREARLAFAQTWSHLSTSDWSEWIWSDETWVTGLGTGRKYVLVFPGEDTGEFASPRMRANGWMFWGCFAGQFKGPGLVWQKAWGRINSETYQQRIMPLFNDFAARHPSYRLQQDNAPAHASKSTTAYFQANNLAGRLVVWPPHSPDLNPIEHVWGWMKRWIEGQAAVQLTGRALEEAVMAAWNAVPEDFLIRLIDSMPRRIVKCIEVSGGYTGY